MHSDATTAGATESNTDALRCASSENVNAINM